MSRDLYERYRTAFDFIFSTVPAIGANPAAGDEAPGRIADLIQDLHRIDALERALAPFNMFEAAGMQRREVHHSHLLFHLLNPRERHGLGTLPVRTFLIKAAELADPKTAIILATVDHEKAKVSREFAIDKRRGDIIVTFEEERVVALIENKVDAGPGQGQLEDYAGWLRANYDGWTQLLVYLTPHGALAPVEGWTTMSYAHVVDMLDIVLDADAQQDGAVALTLHQYREYLARNVAADRHPCTAEALALHVDHASALDHLYHTAAPRAYQPPHVVALRAQMERILSNDSEVEPVGVRGFYPRAWREDAGISALLSGLPIKFFANVNATEVRLTGEMMPWDHPRRAELLQGMQQRFGTKKQGEQRILNRPLVKLDDDTPEGQDKAAAQLALEWAEFSGETLALVTAWLRDLSAPMPEF